MLVAEELAHLRGTIAELEEKYCQNCQEWDCDYCWANADLKNIAYQSSQIADALNREAERRTDESD